MVGDFRYPKLRENRSLPFVLASQKTYRTKLANRKKPAKHEVAGFCCIRIKHFAPIWGFKGQWRMITRYRKLRLGYQCNFLHAKLMVQFLCLATSINPSDTPKTQNSSHQVPVRLNVAFRCSKFTRIQISTLLGTNISHLWKRKIIFPAILKTKICEFPGGYLTHFIYPQLDPPSFLRLLFWGLALNQLRPRRPLRWAGSKKAPEVKIKRSVPWRDNLKLVDPAGMVDSNMMDMWV